MVGRSGDVFGRFYHDNLRGLRSYIARLLPNSAEADDLANEAFARVFAASTAERPVPPRAYLYSAAHNITMNQLRQRRVRGEFANIEEQGDIADPAPSADRDLIARERIQMLWDAVNQLPPRCRQVFIMRKVDQISNADIAEKLGISVSAVEKHIRLGLQSCRAYLASFEVEDTDGTGDKNGQGHAKQS